jgi:hypothetical protein
LIKALTGCHDLLLAIMVFNLYCMRIYLKELIATNAMSFDGSKPLAQQVKGFMIELVV